MFFFLGIECSGNKQKISERYFCDLGLEDDGNGLDDGLNVEVGDGALWLVATRRHRRSEFLLGHFQI